MARPISNIPIVLFPLKLETRFIGDKLLIRALPDLPFLESHDPRLSKEELQSAYRFKEALTAFESTSEDEDPELYQEKEEALEIAWEKLVAKYGIYRSAWIVQIGQKELDRQRKITEEDGGKAADTIPSFYFKWLPDHLNFYLYKAGDAIDDPAYTAEGATIEEDGLSVLGEGDDWIEDFPKAVEAGMGVEVYLEKDLGASDLSFEKIIVCGFRIKEDAVESAEGLAKLLYNHQYTEGFSFLKYGTATNNTEKGRSGYSAKDEFDAPKSFHYAVHGLDLSERKADQLSDFVQQRTAGKHLSHSLGFEAGHLNHVQNADLVLPKMHDLFQAASWFALGAQPLFLLFDEQISSETHLSIWKHFSKYVKARGPYTPLRIGNQPYGILPVMNISRALTDKRIKDSDELVDKMTVLFARLMKRWLQMAKEQKDLIPRLGDENDTLEEILKILSMQENSSSYQIRALKYHFFQRELYKFLKRGPTGSSADLDSAIPSHSDLRKAFDLVQQRVDSLLSLLNGQDGQNDGKTIDGDQLLRSALLSFTEGSSSLIGFDGENATMTDADGHPVVREGTEADSPADNSFSFTEKDLKNFRDFIENLKTQPSGRLIPYPGELSLFTDLFLRSYNGALQLYTREVVFDPDTTEMAGYRYPRAAKLLKTVGDRVERGDIVLEVEGAPNTSGAGSKTLAVVAPFDGVIKRIMIPPGGSEAAPGELRAGMRLFTLVNEEANQEIKELFIALGQQMIDELSAIPELEKQTALQKSAMGEAFDLSSHRLDAWITSLASRRIEAMRQRYEKGMYFGAYGWVEDLRRDNEKPVRAVNGVYTDENRNEEGGFIHTPGAAQAIASAVFKNAYLKRTSEDNTNPFTLNLTSDRLQKAQFLLEGIRQGQELEALLGYQLERYLHEHPEGGLHREIYALREAFPLYENTSRINGQTTGFVQLSVIDGLKAIKHKDQLPLNGSENRAAVVGYIDKLEDILDGSLDTLFYEAGYQITQGNLSQAAAALDATKGEIAPPVTESLKTKISGTGISHKLVMVLPAVSRTYPLDAPRAWVAPALETWLEEHLGPMSEIACMVERLHAEDDSYIDDVTVGLEELAITYLDLLHLSQDPLSDGASELELRIAKVASAKWEPRPEPTKYRISDLEPGDRQSLAKALEVARYTSSLLSKCRPLKSEDLSLEGDPVGYDWETLNTIKDERLSPLIQRVKSVIETGLEQPENLNFLAKLDLEAAKSFLFGDGSVDMEQLRSAIEKKLRDIDHLWAQYSDQSSFDTAYNLLDQIAKLLFGPTFIFLPPVLSSSRFAEAARDQRQSRLVGDPALDQPGQVWGQQRIKHWVQGVAQVQENTEAFEDWLMIDEVWHQLTGRSQQNEFRIVQGPTLLQYPWVALSREEIRHLLENRYTPEDIYQDPKAGSPYPLNGEDYYPDGCTSTVLYLPAGIGQAGSEERGPQFGLVVEEFSEHIPDKQVDTGLSFHYNAPNNESPQAILLAVHPKATMTSNYNWKEEELRDIIFDTVDLYKIRLVDMEAMQEYGYVLPMSYWLNIPSVK